MGVTSSGDVDVGFATQGEQVGVTVHAPKVGVLKLAVEVSGKGAPRLSALERVHAGKTQTVALTHELEVLELEAELARAQLALVRFELHAADSLAEMVTARDEARDRAAAYAEQLETTEAQGTQTASELEKQLHEVRTALAVEREGRLSALSDRERSRHELQAKIDALEAQLQELKRSSERSGSAAVELESRVQTLELDLAAARLRGDDAEERTAANETRLRDAENRAHDAEARAREAEERVLAAEAKAQSELAQAGTQTEASKAEADALQAKISELEQKMADVEARLAAEEEAQAAKVADLEAGQLAAQGRAAEAEQRVAEARLELAEARAKLGDSETNVTELRARLKTLEQSRFELQSRAEEAELAKQQLLEAEARAAQAESVKTELLEAQARVSELELRAGEAETAKGQLLDAQGRIAELESDLKAAAARAAELQNEATQVTEAEVRIANTTRERDEARNIARQVQAQATKLLAERDEARSIARTLHAQVEALKAEQKATVRQKLITEPGSPQAAATAIMPTLGTAKAPQQATALMPAPVLPKPDDASRQPTMPYNLQKIRASQPSSEWGEESTVTEPITTVPITTVPTTTVPTTEGTDPLVPVVKPKKSL